MSGICVYCESFNNKPDETVSELLTAALQIKKVTGEPVYAIAVSKDCRQLAKRLSNFCFDEIFGVETGRDCMFQDDAVSSVISEMLRKIEPSTVLIPATPLSRSIFSRTAAELGCGLTADCTDIETVKKHDGTYFIKQNKPSYGENVMVSIAAKQGILPQMMTIRQGVFGPCNENNSAKPVKITMLDEIEIGQSKIRIIESAPLKRAGDSILAADVVVVGGRGALEGGNFGLLERFAEKIGGVVGGTRPLADTEIIPFENQIGQTGCTIRPKICVSFGVSGAIQHTEGIKDTKLFIAVNTDEQAPIFSISNYGVLTDMNELLVSLLENL